MTWGEALRLFRLLRADTTSQTAAACEGWEFPTSREHLAMLDVFDITVLANSDTKGGKPRPHPGRPYKQKDRREQKFGDTGGRTREQIVEILNGLGHQLPV